MNEYVKGSIDARKDAFSNGYELNDKFKKQIDDLFVEIYKFGESSTDAMDFENKFQASDLNQKYIDLFTQVAKSCKPKEIVHADNDVIEKTKGEKVLDEAASDAKYLVDDITMPARRQARMKMESKMRETPLGDIEQASNMFHLFKKFKKKKPEEINEEEN